jgi:hypothetical protein
MPLPVKISDRLLALARQEAQHTHRSATGQIEHWATLGRAVEAMIAYGDVLALKRVGEIPVPAELSREAIHEVLAALGQAHDRGGVKARIRASMGDAAVYTIDAAHPGKIVEVRPDGTRTPGRLEGRRFVAEGSEPPIRVAARVRRRARG